MCMYICQALRPPWVSKLTAKLLSSILLDAILQHEQHERKSEQAHIPHTVDPQISRRQISGRFSIRTIFLGNRFLLRYFVSFIMVDFYDRCLSNLVNIPELGVNCCKNTDLAYCFYKTMCNNVWPIVCNSLSVTSIDWPVIWIRDTYLIKLNALYWITKKILNIL